MAEALVKLKDGLVHPATTGDTDGSLLTNLLEALTAGAQLNVGQKGRVTHTAVNYTAATQIVDDHLAGIDTALGAGPSHLMGGSSHTTDSLANLNSKITGGSVDFNTAQRTPIIHDLGSNLRHGSDTLAHLNALITGGNLDFDTTSRPPSGSAGGALIGSYPDPDLKHDQVSTATLYTCENTSWEDITGMSITPLAGTYLVWFSANVIRAATDDNAYIALFVEAAADGNSYRVDNITIDRFHSIETQSVRTVNGSQAIKAKARVLDAGTDFKFYHRSLMILRVAD